VALQVDNASSLIFFDVRGGSCADSFLFALGMISIIMDNKGLRLKGCILADNN
jgi:hypothetical protein